MSLFGNKKINAFGLDISDTSIKIIQLKQKGKATLLQAFADVPLIEKVINNHMIVDEARLAQNIKRALGAARHVDTKYVVCSIPETKSFVRSVEMPKIPEDEIAGAIPYEVEQDIPIPIDQVYLDWQLIQETSQNLKLLVTATPKDYVDSLVSCLHSIKLKPLGLELESQATARALIGAADATRNILIVDISTFQTSFIVVQQGNIAYTSSIPVAGRALTESIAASSGISLAEAENIYRTIDFASNNTGRMVLPILDKIVEEVKNVIRFFAEHSPGSGPIDTILLCGGGAKLSGIADYMTKQLITSPASVITSVRLGNPWVNIPTAGQNNALSVPDSLGFVTAAGLALRGYQYHEDN